MGNLTSILSEKIEELAPLVEAFSPSSTKYFTALDTDGVLQSVALIKLIIEFCNEMVTNKDFMDKLKDVSSFIKDELTKESIKLNDKYNIGNDGA